MEGRISLGRKPQLRAAIEAFDARQQRLTLPFLLSGFYVGHTFCVSLATFVISAALAIGCGPSSSSSSSLSSASSFAPLFSSCTSFVSISVLFLMTSTLLYRIVGGPLSCSKQAIDQVVDWIIGGQLQVMVQSIGSALLEPRNTRGRLHFFFGLFVIGEIGKWSSFWGTMTLASMIWCIWSGYQLWSGKQRARETELVAGDMR